MTTAAQFEPYRPYLVGHCYRMLGSVVEAEDAVQEALVRAWTHAEGFRGESSLKTWLYRIATNVCLDALAASKRRRVRPVDATAAPGTVSPDLVLTTQPRAHWVEPIPDAAALPDESEAGPEERAVLRESIRLAFVAALQFLPPRQRAALLLTQVLNLSAAEAADTLEMTVPALNSALQRARATLDARNPTVVPRKLTDAQERTVAGYVAAFERYDVDAIAALLHDEAVLSMPPYDLWLQGPAEIAAWLRSLGAGCEGSVLVPVAACGGMPAFAQYRQHGAEPWALLVLELEGPKVTSMTSFLDVETLFPRFGVPMQWPG